MSITTAREISGHNIKKLFVMTDEFVVGENLPFY